MSTDNQSAKPRSPADVGWDDDTLWLDADVAAFLRLDVRDVDAAVASGVPCVYVAKERRFVPAEVREHCARRSLSVIMAAPPKRVTMTPSMRQSPLRRPSACSGRLVQS